MAQDEAGVRFVESTADVLTEERERTARGGAGGAPETLVVHFAQPLEDRGEFFGWVAERFQLPSYFGHNWDALEECWRDLGWILPVARVVLVFDILPLATQPQQQQLFFEILRTLVDDRQPAQLPRWELIVAARLRSAFERTWYRVP